MLTIQLEKIKHSSN